MDKWIRFLKPYFISAMCGLLVGGLSIASPIKNWTSNEYVTYTDLNNNFNHLHANLGHGHGPIITANDIASNAGIRPEQTTFGLSVNKSLKFEGTFRYNPDGGNTYVPVNSSGTLGITVTKNINGVFIQGAAGSGVLTDAGTQLYTIFYKALNGVRADGGVGNIICTDISQTLTSPFSVTAFCDNLSGVVGGIEPYGISLLVYSNATVP